MRANRRLLNAFVPSPPLESWYKQHQLMGGVSNDRELVKHAPQSHHSSVCAQREQQLLTPPTAALLILHSGHRFYLFLKLIIDMSDTQEVPLGMDVVERTAPVSRLERSGHTAFIDNNTLYVWGGYQVSAYYLQVNLLRLAIKNKHLKRKTVVRLAAGDVRNVFFCVRRLQKSCNN